MNLIQKPFRLIGSGILIIAGATAMFNCSLTNTKKINSVMAVSKAHADAPCIAAPGRQCFEWIEGTIPHFITDQENI